MELLKSYIEILRDPSVPSHRIVRKTTGLCLIAICLLFYYRHFSLELETGESLLFTVIIALVGFSIVGIVGSLFSGSFYESFLRDVGAHQEKFSLNVFFAEWLFATLPFGVLAFSAFLQ